MTKTSFFLRIVPYLIFSLLAILSCLVMNTLLSGSESLKKDNHLQQARIKKLEKEKLSDSIKNKAIAENLSFACHQLDSAKRRIIIEKNKSVQSYQKLSVLEKNLNIFEEKLAYQHTKETNFLLEINDLSNLNKYLDSLLNACKRESIANFAAKQYALYNISDTLYTIELKGRFVDLLFLKNERKSLFVNVLQPQNIALKDILYTPENLSDSFIRSDGQVGSAQYLLLNVAKIKQINEDITLQFKSLSLSDSEEHPFSITIQIK